MLQMIEGAFRYMVVIVILIDLPLDDKARLGSYMQFSKYTHTHSLSLRRINASGIEQRRRQGRIARLCKSEQIHTHKHPTSSGVSKMIGMEATTGAGRERKCGRE